MSRKRHKGIQSRVRSKVGRALADYSMTTDGDRLLVAVSGGKDSLALLHILETRKSFIPIDYQLEPVFVSLGESDDQPRLRVLELVCRNLGLKLHVVGTDIGQRLRRGDLPESNCFHCSRWKRRALFERARKEQINKIAFGHHRDDIIETALLNLFYGSNFSTMVPHQRLFNGTFSLIRPLAYLDEQEVIAYCRLQNLPVDQPPCRFAADEQKRMRIRNLLALLENDNPRIKGSIFHALKNVRSDYLLNIGYGQEPLEG
jgi:tRNA 2-thiocytidine biosynthesis protein TtcA